MFEHKVVILELPKSTLTPLNGITHKIEELEYLLPSLINTMVSEYVNKEIGGGKLEYMDRVIGEMYENDTLYNHEDDCYITQQSFEITYTTFKNNIVNILKSNGVMSLLIKTMVESKLCCQECNVVEYSETLRCTLYLLRQI